MNKKQIIDKYFKHLFNSSKNHQDKMFFSCDKDIDGFYRRSDEILIVPVMKKIKESDTVINPEHLRKLKEQHIKLNLDHYNGFMEFINSSTEKQDLFYKNIALACRIQLPNSGVSDPTNENLLAFILNKETFLNLLKDTNSKEQEYIASNINHFLIKPFNREFSSIIKLLKEIKQVGYKSFADIALEHISTSIVDINDYRMKELFPKIVQLLKDYKGDDDIDKELANLMCKRAFQVKKSKNNELLIRNVLLDYYSQDVEKLKPYAPHFKSVTEYLHNLSSSDNVLVEEEVLVQSIDFIKFKAVVTKNWSTVEYKSILEKFCKVYEAKEDKIKKINYAVLKLGKGVEHFMLYICVNKESKGLELEEIRQKINNFISHLKSSDEKDVLKLDYIAKWFDAEKLNNSLKDKSEVKTKRNKI